MYCIPGNNSILCAPDFNSTSIISAILACCLGDFIRRTKIGINSDDDISYIYDLPSDFFDCLLPRLPALALQKLQDGLPLNRGDEHEVACINQRKRKRCEKFETAWRTLYKSRFPGVVREIELMYCSAKGLGNYEFENDWQQMYWEIHLHSCLAAAAEKAVHPYFEGCLGEIKIPDGLLKPIGYEQCRSNSEVDWSKLSYQCQQFALYARDLRLPSVLCQAEIGHLLRNSKLQALELRWIKSREQVEGLCKLLSQNGETLTSVKIIHSKLSSDFVNAICDSLHRKGLQTHGIQIFSINTSSFLEANSFSIPVGIESFLSSARSLSSVSFHDKQLRHNCAKMIFSALLDASSSIAILNLSENNISGWLSDFKWRPSGHLQLNSGVGKLLKSLRVLKLRSNNLEKHDADCLKCALVHMPNLENLDLSDNPIEDDGIKCLIPYFVEISERLTPFVDLKLENCDLTCHGVSHLLQVLSTLKEPLQSLSIGENNLGSKMGVHLGNFLCTGINALDIEDIGLGSSGFLEARENITEGLKLVSINISKNAGGVEAAKFISKLIVSAPELVEVNASYNILLVESVPIICSSLENAEGKLEHLDLTGNVLCGQPASVSMLEGYHINGKPIVTIWPAPASSYTI